MSTTIEKHVEKSEASRRPWKLIVLVVVVFPFFLLFNWHLYFYNAGSSELQTALAETDRIDPSWRVDDLQAARAMIPDAENSALQVIKVVGLGSDPRPALLPRGWDVWQTEDFKNHLPQPNQLLRQEQVDILRREYAAIPAALGEARRLVDMPRGRHSFQDDKDCINMLLPHIHSAQIAANSLLYDAYLLAHDGKIDEALRSCRACLNAGRSLGDEPIVLSAEVRINCCYSAARGIERVLGQGQGSEKQLAALHRLLEQEANEPLLWNAIRGERAYMDRYCDAIQAGEINMKNVLFAVYTFDSVKPLIADGVFPAFNHMINSVQAYYYIGPIQRNRAALLRYYNELVGVFGLPLHEQGKEAARLSHDFQSRVANLLLARSLAANLAYMIETHRRHLSRMNCIIVIVAAERYRLANGRWPDSLNDLVPTYLAAVSEDPLLKGPIHYKRLADGVVIYSAGRNGIDDGGKLDRKTNGQAKDSDVGFQLWDVAQRGKPPTK